jgi:iron complex outermembrane receptor protein
VTCTVYYGLKLGTFIQVVDGTGEVEMRVSEPNSFHTYCRVIGAAIAGISISLTTSAQGVSQEAKDKKDDLVEVIVTGSYIRRDSFDNATPITVVDREAIVNEGASTILDVARYLPVNTGSILYQEAGNLVGTSQFNLRGLGLGSTLTLINGRRAGKSAIADDGGNQFFDINQLPLSMIERMDVQTDGASAIYGSDAVGGVVNIITRKGMEGFEASVKANSGVSDSGSVSVAMGAKNDTMTVNLYATYFHQDWAYHDDMPWIRDRLGVFTSSSGSPGNYRRAVLDSTGKFVSAAGNTVADPDCEAALGILANSRCQYSLYGRTSPIPAEDRLQVFTEGEIELSDTAKVFGEFHYSNNRVQRVFGPNNPANGKANGALLITANHPFNFWVSDGGTGIRYINPKDWNNAIHTAVPIVYGGRPLGAEFHGALTGCADCKEVNLEFNTNYFRALVGGRKEFGEWRGDVSYVYNRTERTFINAYQFVGSALNEAIEDGSFNPFGTRVASPTLVSPKNGKSTAGLTQAVWDRFHHRGRDYSTSTQSVVDMVVSGPVGTLPGGDIGLAVGTQLRKENFELLRDPLEAAGLGSRPEKQDPEVTGAQDVTAYFSEVLLPVTDSIELAAAVRYEDYGGNTGSTVDPKVTAKWQINEPLALRASFGTSFQAPTTFQTSQSQGSEFLNDPAGLNAQGQLVCRSGGVATTGNNATIFVGGDEGLKPQTSKNINLGLVYDPTSALRVSVDYWSFNYVDLIRPNANAQSLVDNDCRSDGIPNDPRIKRSLSGTLQSVSLSFINTGELVTRGVDLQGTYQLPQTSFGEFALVGALSYVTKFEITNENGSKTDGAGSRNFGNPFPSIPELRGNVRLSWTHGSHSAFLAARYTDGYSNDQPVVPLPISSWTAIDLRYNYEMGEFFGGDTSFAIGALNALDKDPPSLGQGQRPGYDDEVADIRGRTVYAEITARF